MVVLPASWQRIPDTRTRMLACIGMEKRLKKKAYSLHDTLNAELELLTLHFGGRAPSQLAMHSGHAHPHACMHRH